MKENAQIFKVLLCPSLERRKEEAERKRIQYEEVRSQMIRSRFNKELQPLKISPVIDTFL